MRFKLELSIDKPRTEVWKAFDDPEKMKIWQPSLTQFELVSGTAGQPDAVSKLTYRENDREFSLIERITDRREPELFHGVYDNPFAENSIHNEFIEQGDGQTLWVMETDYRFKTLIMKILGLLLKKNYVARTEKYMERFKEMVERQ